MLDPSGRRRYSSAVRANQMLTLPQLAFLLILPLLLSGCLFSRESESRGVKLSEAMEQGRRI